MRFSVPFTYRILLTPFKHHFKATFTIYQPRSTFKLMGSASRAAHRTPLLYFMHGFAVADGYYSRLLSQLTDKGYMVASGDVMQPSYIPIPGLPRE